MEKLNAFLSSFANYFMIYVVFIVVIIAGLMLGIATSKKKSDKDVKTIEQNEDVTAESGSN